MTYEIRLDVFEGPFDLLVHLIEKNQVDIYDIPIAEITRQYMEHLAAMAELDMEIASSFLVMAAKLLSIKARMLVPSAKAQPEDEALVDERAELVQDILEYISYKKAADALEDFSKAESRYFDRPNDEQMYLHLFEERNPFDGKTVSDLLSAFQKVLEDAKKQPHVLEIAYEAVTIKDKMRDIFQLLKGKPKGMGFFRIFEGNFSRVVLTVTFLALLELIHQGVVKVRQHAEFEEIFLYPYHMNNYIN